VIHVILEDSCLSNKPEYIAFLSLLFSINILYTLIQSIHLLFFCVSFAIRFMKQGAAGIYWRWEIDIFNRFSRIRTCVLSEHWKVSTANQISRENGANESLHDDDGTDWWSWASDDELRTFHLQLETQRYSFTVQSLKFQYSISKTRRSLSYSVCLC
jgi:hypothetical protein